MATAKRWIALAGAVLLAAVAALALWTLSAALAESRNGADPASAFRDHDAFEAEVSWLPDGEDLARDVPPATRDDLARSWIRSRDALARAAADDLSGLDVWFVDGALDRARERYASVEETLAAPSAADYGMSVGFVSVDGQVVVLDVTTTSSDKLGELRAVMVLHDGNWRVRALTTL